MHESKIGISRRCGTAPLRPLLEQSGKIGLIKRIYEYVVRPWPFSNSPQHQQTAYRDPNSHRRAGWQFAKLVSQGLHFTDNAQQEASVGC